jgi:hypothetical protein
MKLSTFLCQRRLQWSGHIVRMDESLVPKDIMRRCYGEEVPWKSLEVHRRMLFGGMP